jgi:hypothetical protein
MMAFGYEVYLGFVGGDAVRKFAAALGFEFGSADPARGDAWEPESDKKGKPVPSPVATRLAEVDALLSEAQKELFAAVGWTRKGVSKGSGYEVWETPLGLREFSAFSLCLHLDEHECEEDPEEDGVLGVGLSSRYFPVFLDWADPSGALYTLKLDDEFKRLTDLAREKIAERLPAFAEAGLVVKPVWY